MSGAVAKNVFYVLAEEELIEKQERHERRMRRRQERQAARAAAAAAEAAPAAAGAGEHQQRQEAGAEGSKPGKSRWADFSEDDDDFVQVQTVSQFRDNSSSDKAAARSGGDRCTRASGASSTRRKAPGVREIHDNDAFYTQTSENSGEDDESSDGSGDSLGGPRDAHASGATAATDEEESEEPNDNKSEMAKNDRTGVERGGARKQNKGQETRQHQQQRRRRQEGKGRAGKDEEGLVSTGQKTESRKEKKQRELAELDAIFSELQKPVTESSTHSVSGRQADGGGASSTAKAHDTTLRATNGPTALSLEGSKDRSGRAVGGSNEASKKKKKKKKPVNAAGTAGVGEGAASEDQKDEKARNEPRQPPTVLPAAAKIAGGVGGRRTAAPGRSTAPNMEAWKLAAEEEKKKTCKKEKKPKLYFPKPYQ